MKKTLLTITLTLSLLCGIPAYAAGFSDVAASSSYSAAVKRISALGIIKGFEDGAFKPDDLLSREQFAAVMVKSANLEDGAQTASTLFSFPDVSESRWSNGYIKVSLDQGFIKGMPDGSFHPDEPVNFGQVCTVMVRALGYTDTDVTGVWPNSYIDKAKQLKIADAINLSADANMPRWGLAVMLDKLVSTDIKGSSATKYADSTGLFEEIIVLGDSSTLSKLTDKDLMTDKGIYTIADPSMKFDIGNKYRVKIDDDNGDEVIENIYDKMTDIKTIKVTGVTGSDINYVEDGQEKTMVLPDKTVYYYNGELKTYSSLLGGISRNMQIVFSYEKQGQYVSAVLLDPVPQSVGTYSECIVLDNSQTLKKLSENQVLTDKGIYYVPSTLEKPQLGGKYGFIIKDDSIVSVVDQQMTLDNKTVSKFSESIFPDKTVYYHNGEVTAYDDLAGLITVNTSVVFASLPGKNGYEYAVIYDPQYSKPEVVDEVTPGMEKIGSIDLASNPTIVLKNKTISLADLKQYDVAYMVTDIWGKNGYVLVLDTEAKGIITDILPDKAAPTSIKIDDVSYTLGEYMDLNKINSSPNSFKLNSFVTALFDKDGKITDLVDDAGNYAVVMSESEKTSTDTWDYGQRVYDVKLMLTDGLAKTYTTSSDPVLLKGLPVKFTIDDHGRVVLTSALVYARRDKMVFDKYERKLGDSYFADNVKVFNIIENSSSAETQVEALDLEDVPNGVIEPGQIRCINTSGPFGDINFLVLNDIFNTAYKYVYVKENTDRRNSGGDSLYSYSAQYGDTSYTLRTTNIAFTADSVLKARFSNGNITPAVTLQKPAAEGTAIQALDHSKIKINDVIYKFSDDIKIYMKNKDGDVSSLTYDQVNTSTQYKNVSVYLDKAVEDGGKAVAITIQTN